MFLVLLCFNLAPLFAEFQSSIEFRAAAFFPSSNLFRKIYGNMSGDYQLEAATQICPHLDSWVNIDGYSKKGRSVGFSDPTRVSIANLSVGIKLPYQIHEKFIIYIGIGPSLSWIFIHNKFHDYHQKKIQMVLGGIIKSGINYFINSNLFLDLFLDYLYQPAHFERTVDIGGIKTGVGLGYRF
jgi:hypothetical protein